MASKGMEKVFQVPVTGLEEFVETVLDCGIHAATRGSLASFAVGLMGAESMTLHRIGKAMADNYHLQKKHTTKQLDRFLTSSSLDVFQAQSALVRHILKDRREVMLAVDWTDYDHDDQSTLCAYVLTTHGRALPLIWETHKKSGLKGERTGIECAFLERLSASIPSTLKVIITADRGFGYQEFIHKLHELGLDFVLRVRHNIRVENKDGEARTAAEWLRPNGHAQLLQDVRITGGRTEVNGFVSVRSKKMKDGWFLVTSLCIPNAPPIVKIYGKRFSIEETFRDTKDDRFGLGLRATKIGTPMRRDRLLLICALAYVFIVTLGQAGEDAEVDYFLKVNTSKTRQLSLYRQGLEWIGLLPGLRDSVKIPLLEAFHKRLSQNEFSVLLMNDIQTNN